MNVEELAIDNLTRYLENFFRDSIYKHLSLIGEKSSFLYDLLENALSRIKWKEISEAILKLSPDY